jgi:hypothetical protein
MQAKRNKRAGFIVSAELSLISTVMVSGLMVGMVSIRNAMVGELSDTAAAFGSLNQSYQFRGTQSGGGSASTGGGTFQDVRDQGDGDGYDVMVAPDPES